MKGGGDVEPEYRAHEKSDLNKSEGSVHKPTALAKTRRSSIAYGSTGQVDMDQHKKKQQRYAHAELQQLADVDKQFVLREMADDVDRENGES